MGLVHLLPGGAGAGGHHVDKAIEKIAGVVGAGTSLGVVLDSEDRLRRVAEAFERSVVEIDMRRLGPDGREAVGVDGEAVVLAGDLDPTRVPGPVTGWLAPWCPNFSL